MMIKGELVAKIEREYEEKIQYFGKRKDEIVNGIASVDDFCAVLCKYIYAVLPVSDIGAYDFELFRKYAEHGKFLYENSKYLQNVPDTYFLNYVVCPRINNEDIVTCRKFFHDILIDRIKGMDTEDAAISINNWCFENATYHSTSERTASPMTVYNGGYGRCGEESVFYVAALRSVGIPARQVYVPRWSHSDSNHAWVEVYIDGAWKFTGACEPKPVFNSGWFTYAASRAMLVHSRVFGDFLEEDDQVTGKEGCLTMFNNGKTYSVQEKLRVKVIDENETPIFGASVRVEIVNSSELYSIATVQTGEDGFCEIDLGRGSAHIYATFSYLRGYGFINLEEENEITITLKENYVPEKQQEFLFVAPKSDDSFGVNLTNEQEEFQAGLDKKGEELRKQRLDSYYDDDFVSKYEEFDQITRVLKNAGGNFSQIRDFILEEESGAPLSDKNRLLSALDQKDCRDTSTKELLDHIVAYELEEYFKKNNEDAPDTMKGCFVDNEAVMNSEDIMDEFYRADMDFFTEYVASPHIFTEKITTFRGDIKNILGKNNPFDKPPLIWDYIDKNIEEDGDCEYGTIVASPLSVLTTGRGIDISKQVLFVAICRTYGIAARIDMSSRKAQYFENGAFVYADSSFGKGEEPEKAALTLNFEDEKVPEYCMSYSLSMRNEAGNYFVVNDEALWLNKDKEMTVELLPGEYRLTTCDRLMSGNAFSRVSYFTLESGKEKNISVLTRSPEDNLKTEKLRSFKKITLTSLNGEKTSFKADDNYNVWLFLKAAAEPTEHVLNELLELSKMEKKLGADIYVLVNNKAELSNDLMERVLSQVQHDEYLVEEDICNELLNKTKSELTNYPYICLTKGSDVIFETNGYNVGVVDMLCRIVEK